MSGVEHIAENTQLCLIRELNVCFLIELEAEAWIENTMPPGPHSIYQLTHNSTFLSTNL